MNHADIHKDLIIASRDGSRAAQYELYRLYADAMLNVCLRMVPQRDVAEDILQEAFLKAFTKLHSFKFESSFGSWLKRIVINDAINHMRKKKMDIDYMEDMHGVDETPEETYEGISEEDMSLNVEAIKHAIEQLPEGFRVVFSLYAVEGYDHSEISEILGITISTSKTQYSRARNKIRKLLTNEMCG
ncbi:RNA polymerase sigma factor [Roseivirga sp. BDSF3-8]|uniref:RNA polymerase sigma factor n=1 Tax=Roseivirga sp. BDSF3-8 TaxID=3241598 RepID=UPI003531F868